MDRRSANVTRQSSVSASHAHETRTRHRQTDDRMATRNGENVESIGLSERLPELFVEILH